MSDCREALRCAKAVPRPAFVAVAVRLTKQMRVYRQPKAQTLAVKLSHLAVHNRIEAVVLVYSFVYDEKEDKTMAFFGSFKKSAAELKDIRCLVVTAMLIGLDLVLKFFLNINLTEELKISFAFVAIASIGMLYGPTVGAIACVITDIVGFMIKPSGTFNPLFTLVEVMGGVLYGLFLYNFSPVKPDVESPKAFFKSVLENWVSALRIILAKISVAVVCNLIMTPLFLTFQKQLEASDFTPAVFWAGFISRISTRLIKNAIEVPVHILILMLTLFPIMAAYKAIFRQHKSAT